MNIRKPKAIIDEVGETVGNWHNFADNVKVSPELRDAIAETLIVL